MAQLSYRQAVGTDKAEIAAILKAAITFLREQNINQWQGNSVTIEHIMPAIEQGKAFAWVNTTGDIQAFAVLEEHDAYYDNLTSGEWSYDLPYYAIHRVMIAPASRGRGITAVVFRDIERIAKAHKKQVLRIDTHPENLRMQHIITKMGFTETGEIQHADGTPRITYEKLVV